VTPGLVRLRYALLALGSLVFVRLLWTLGLDAIRRNVAATGWWFLAIMAVWSLAYLLNAGSLAILLGDARHRVGPARILGATVAGFAMNYATPVVHLGGEPFRMMVLAEGAGRVPAAFATLAYKALNALSMVCYWTLALALFIVATPHPPAFVWIAMVVLLAVLSAAGLVLGWMGASPGAALVGLAARHRVLTRLHRALRRHEAALDEIGRHARDLRGRPRVWMGALGLEIAARVGMAFEIFFILRAIALPVSFRTALCIDAATSCAINLLFFVPFEMGVREGGLYLILGAFGLPPATGVYAGLVSRVRELVWMGVGLVWGQWITGASARRFTASEATR
jgi:uncharacterized membrane protein YbhN (UPF0104 family)